MKRVPLTVIAGLIILTIVVAISFHFKAERNSKEYGTALENEELGKIKIDNAQLDHFGFITGNLYNGSGWTIRSVKLTIAVYDKQVTYKEFADAIRAKHAKLYTGMPDKELVEAWIKEKPERQVYLKRLRADGSDSDRTIAFSREYRCTTYVQPEHSTNFIENVGFTLKKDQTWNYRILEATGEK